MGINDLFLAFNISGASETAYEEIKERKNDVSNYGIRGSRKTNLIRFSAKPNPVFPNG